MLPTHTRVAAIDDDVDHLQKIAWGLGRAGFCPISYVFQDGKLEHPPSEPIPGIRVVFSDIHMVSGAPNNEKTHASNIILCLKQIVGNGPYALIFWSQYPEEAERMRLIIEERAAEAGLMRPLGYGRIDKNAVFNIQPAGKDDAFDAAKLRELILQQVSGFSTLAVATSWDNRAAMAAARTTNQLFSLAGNDENRSEIWAQVLAYLACEAVGWNQAKLNVRNALDAALLPLLEDQLTLIGRESDNTGKAIENISEIVSAKKPRRPASAGADRLNSSYQIEELPAGASCKMSDRGAVTELGGGFINSGEFVTAFGLDDKALLLKEFVFNQDLSDQDSWRMKLHLVEIGPECDHAQGKVSTHRYLLALLVPCSLLKMCTQKDMIYRNASVIDTGPLFLSGRDESNHLLISCRCFMALAPTKKIDGRTSFRLRKELLDEVVHHYTTHARRPGVMRFR